MHENVDGVAFFAAAAMTKKKQNGRKTWICTLYSFPDLIDEGQRPGNEIVLT